MKQKHLLFIGAALLCSCNHGVSQLSPKTLGSVVKTLTLDEKLHLVIGQNLDVDAAGTAVVGATENYVPGAAGNTYAISRLGITPAVLADGPAGLRIDPTRKDDKNTYYCTHFPIGTLLASTWNTELVENVGKAIGNEAKEYGVDVLLAPALNIHRNPLCGRNFEYYSEDPLVAGKIAAAYVNGVQSNGVGTSIKHFAVNNQETNRQGVDAIVSQRALREIYLKPFEIAVKEAKPWTVMSSYNYINGTYASQSHDLLTTVLRDEWGFDGMVMTDWYGGKDAVEQMKAGNDLLMPGRKQQYDQLKNALSDGSLNMKVVDKNISRILEMVMRTQRFHNYKYSNQPDLKGHASVTRQSAVEGMVLLKNNGALPFKDINNVALFGNCSYEFIAGGTGSGNVNRAYTVSLLEGMKNAGLKTDDSMQAEYAQHIAFAKTQVKKPEGPMAHFLSAPLPKEKVYDDDRLAAIADANDVAVVTIGRLSGEFVDRKLSDFNLSEEENVLLHKVCDAFHAKNKKVVVLLNIGSVIETASWKSLPDAILLAWQAGQEGGNSVADILTGKVSPSGKLTMTFPNSFADHASSDNFPTEGKMMGFGAKSTEGNKEKLKNIDYTCYAEDVYVGYRYFDSFDKAVSYPFGYGLSYTSFAYSNAAVKRNGSKVVVSVDVANNGQTSGKEVVELYASAPDSKLMNKPMKELKAFAKTRLLAPGEHETLTMTFDCHDLASFDEQQSAWRVDAGRYQLLLGSSSRDIRQTIDLDVEASVVKVNNVLAPKQELKRLTY